MKRRTSLRDAALRMLGRREHFRAELEARLRAAHEDLVESELGALLDEFEREGWLSEERAARQAVAAGRARYGARRIKHDLLARGADAEVVAQAMAEADQEDPRNDEMQRASALLRRRFGDAPQDPRQRARQARFLAGRGFGGSVIGKVLGSGDESEQR